MGTHNIVIRARVHWSTMSLQENAAPWTNTIRSSVLQEIASSTMTSLQLITILTTVTPPALSTMILTQFSIALKAEITTTMKARKARKPTQMRTQSALKRCESRV